MGVMQTNQLLKRTAALAAAAIIGSTLALAADDGGGGGGGAWGCIRERIHQRLVQLGISAEERDQIREVLKGSAALSVGSKATETAPRRPSRHGRRRVCL